MKNPFSTLPAHLAVFQLVSEQLAEWRPVLEGSAAEGREDEWSDIDLRVTVPWLHLNETAIAVRTALSCTPGVFTTFPADHIGFPYLFIGCVDAVKTIIKVDVKVEPDQLPPSGCASWTKPPFWDWDGLTNRACGWTWYVYCKIRRGEYLEAADGLDLLRTKAVLSLYHEALQIPREGFRRAEQRLSPGLRAALWNSRPKCGEPAELMRCLEVLFHLVEEVWKRKCEVPHKGMQVVRRELRRAHE
jgi:hypothetical protein